MPKLEMPGAVLVGDSAGTLNVPKIKGIHQAIRCGIAAADYFADNNTSIGLKIQQNDRPRRNGPAGGLQGPRELEAQRADAKL